MAVADRTVKQDDKVIVLLDGLLLVRFIGTLQNLKFNATAASRTTAAASTVSSPWCQFTACLQALMAGSFRFDDGANLGTMNKT